MSIPSYFVGRRRVLRDALGALSQGIGSVLSSSARSLCRILPQRSALLPGAGSFAYRRRTAIGPWGETLPPGATQAQNPHQRANF